MQFLVQTLLHTPWWVFPLLGYLIYTGFQATKTRVVHLKHLLIVPSIVAGISLFNLVATAKELSSYLVWAFAIGIGTIVGWYWISRIKLMVDRQRSLIQVPGTWSTMILTILIFIAKYYQGFKLATSPEIAGEILFTVQSLGVSGIFTGLFIGRLLGYLRCYKSGVNCNISLVKLLSQ